MTAFVLHFVVGKWKSVHIASGLGCIRCEISLQDLLQGTRWRHWDLPDGNKFFLKMHLNQSVNKQENYVVLLVSVYTLLVCVCVCMCVCGHVYVVYEDTNLYNDMGMT